MKFDSSFFWSSRYAPWIILTLLAGFTLLTLIEIVSVFTFRYALNTPDTKEVTQPLVMKEEKIAENLDTELFGIYLPPEVKSAEIKPSRLKVELIGIMYADNPQDSLVIIKSYNGEEQGFKVGESIEDNAVIDSILPDGIVVEHNGALEKLDFSVDELKFEPVSEPLIED